MARTSAAVRESIADAIEWLKFADAVWKRQREREDEDLSFQSAEGAWPTEVAATRGPQNAVAARNLPALPGRPMLSVASVDEPIALVSAEERKAHLGVTVHALSEDAADDTANVLTGLYRAIENDSRAQNVRSWAYQRALWAGLGAYRVNKVYDPEGGHAFDQKLILERILYQSHVIRDPFAKNPDFSDARRCMVIDDMPWSTYKTKYRTSQITRSGVDNLAAVQAEFPEWVQLGEGTDETRAVRVAEDWRVEIEERRIVLLVDGSTAFEDEVDAALVCAGDDARSAVVEKRRVFWRVINCVEELEPEQEWDGQYIPIITTIGRELQPVHGKRQWYGMVSNAKDAVRLTNYAASSAVEMAALEPKAPYEWDPEVIEGFEEFWNTSNTKNWPGLPYHSMVRGVPKEPPRRSQADMSRLGPSMTLLQMGQGFVQTATATHPPSLGIDTPAHRSGRAITALQDQSIQANTPYLDNLAAVSMPYEAMVILDLIPYIYDRPGRVARVLDSKGNSTQVMFNQPFVPHPETQQPIPLPTGTPLEQMATQRLVNNPEHPAKHYDLNKGRYGVTVQIGKSQPSRLAAGNDALSALMQADPALVPVLGPEWAKFQDFPGAESVAALLTKMRDHTMPWLAEKPQGPAQDPQRLAAENAQLKQQLDVAMKILGTKQVEQQGKLHVTQIQEAAETQRTREDNETKLAIAAISSKVESLQNMMTLFAEERARLGVQAHEAAQAGQDRLHEAAMAMGDHQAGLVEADQAHQQALAQTAQSALLPSPPAGPNGQPGGPV